MLLDTLSTNLNKALATDATDTSFPSKIPTGTEPAGNGVLELRHHGNTSQNGIFLLPYATAGDNDTFSMRVIGWRVAGNNPNTLLWVPYVLLELACTCCTVVGVAGKTVVATERFVDTISIVGTSGNDDVSVDIVSPTGNVLAHVLGDMKGSAKVELTFDTTAAGTTAMNCLYSFV